MHVRVYGEYVHFECTVLEAVEDGNKNFGHLSKAEIFAHRSGARTKLPSVAEIYEASGSCVGKDSVSVNSNVSKKIASH